MMQFRRSMLPEAEPKYQPELPAELVTEVELDLPLLVVVKGLSLHDKEFHQLHVGDNLAEALMTAGPTRWGGSGISLFRNCLKKENKIDLLTVPDIEVAAGDLFIAYVGAADPISATVLAAVVLGGGYAVITGAVVTGLFIGAAILAGGLVGMFLFQPPSLKTPEGLSDQGAGQGTLGIPQNRARLGSRIPEIYGFVRTWPDLIAPPIDIYNNKRYTLTVYYCLGVGFYRFTHFKFGDVKTEKFPGTTVNIIHPDQVPFAHGLLLDTPENEGFQLTPLGEYTPWTSLPGVDMTEVWVDIAFPGGLVRYSSSSGDVAAQSVSGVLEFRELHSDGSVGSIAVRNWSRTAKNTGMVRYTLREPTPYPARWQVRVAKTAVSSSTDDLHVHDCEIARMAAYKVVTVSHNRYTRDRTYIQVVVDTSRTATARNYDDFNVTVNRFQPTLTSSGITTADTGQRWCDAMIDMLLDPFCGGYTLPEVDTTTLLSIHNKLHVIDAAKGEKFNWIFDRFMDVDTQLQATANAQRCAVVHDFGRVTFIRDEKKTGVTALLTDRNRLESDEGGKTITFPTPDEPDGVEIEWFDVDNKYVKRIYRYPDNIQIFNPRKIDVIGLQNWSQVYRRAVFEYNKQVLRRRTNTFITLEEGVLMLPMDLVEVVDAYRGFSVQGEIINYSSGTSPPFIDVEPSIVVQSGDHIIINKSDGRDTDRVGLASPTQLGVLTSRIYLARTFIFTPGRSVEEAGPLHGKLQAAARFFLGNPIEHDRQTWLVGSVKPQDEKVQVTLIEYDPNIYAGDTGAIPANPPVVG